MEHLEKKLKETCIEIKNLPTDNNAQMELAIEQIHKSLNINFNPADIKSAYRVATRRHGPRPIIVEYANVKIKEELLQAFKNYNKNNKGDKLNTTIVDWSKSKDHIYIKESLTKNGNYLFYLARDLIRKSDWKFCWSNRGRIYVRKSEGSPAIEIINQEQIQQLINNIPEQ